MPALGSHSQVSCKGLPSTPAVSFSMPPKSTARLREESQTSPKSCRAAGLAAGFSWVQPRLVGSHSQVSPKETEIPLPSEEEESLRPPPNSKILPVDFS